MKRVERTTYTDRQELDDKAPEEGQKDSKALKISSNALLTNLPTKTGSGAIRHVGKIGRTEKEFSSKTEASPARHDPRARRRSHEQGPYSEKSAIQKTPWQRESRQHQWSPLAEELERYRAQEAMRALNEPTHAAKKPTGFGAKELGERLQAMRAAKNAPQDASISGPGSDVDWDEPIDAPSSRSFYENFRGSAWTSRTFTEETRSEDRRAYWSQECKIYGITSDQESYSDSQSIYSGRRKGAARNMPKWRPLRLALAQGNSLFGPEGKSSDFSSADATTVSLPQRRSGATSDSVSLTPFPSGSESDVPPPSPLSVSGKPTSGLQSNINPSGRRPPSVNFSRALAEPLFGPQSNVNPSGRRALKRMARESSELISGEEPTVVPARQVRPTIAQRLFKKGNAPLLSKHGEKLPKSKKFTGLRGLLFKKATNQEIQKLLAKKGAPAKLEQRLEQAIPKVRQQVAKIPGGAALLNQPIDEGCVERAGKLFLRATLRGGNFLTNRGMQPVFAELFSKHRLVYVSADLADRRSVVGLVKQAEQAGAAVVFHEGLSFKAGQALNRFCRDRAAHNPLETNGGPSEPIAIIPFNTLDPAVEDAFPFEMQEDAKGLLETGQSLAMAPVLAESMAHRPADERCLVIVPPSSLSSQQDAVLPPHFLIPGPVILKSQRHYGSCGHVICDASVTPMIKNFTTGEGPAHLRQTILVDLYEAQRKLPQIAPIPSSDGSDDTSTASIPHDNR